MMPTLPTLPATLPVRPDAALPAAPDAAADLPSAGPGGFARAMRDAEAPAQKPEPAAEPVRARETRPPARERTGPGRTRAGDTPETTDPSRSAALRARADAAGAQETESTPTTSSNDSVDGAAAVDAQTVDATDEFLALLPDASALAPPAAPIASRPASDRSPSLDAGAAADPLGATAGAGRRPFGPVGGHALPSRHPFAEVDARTRSAPSASHTIASADSRGRAAERTGDPPLLAAAVTVAAAKAAAIEPPTTSASAIPTVEQTTPMSSGAAGVAVLTSDRPAGLTAAEPARSMAEARLAAPPGSPAFTHALGEQVGVWVRDGVQEARLQLHPAELGPVQIQIALEGQSAQIDFHAAHARTREAIEASLPALASALRESGFTLAGGGVFGQGAGDQPSRSPPRAPRDGAPPPFGTDAVAASGDDALAAAAARSRGWRRGLLDVFA